MSTLKIDTIENIDGTISISLAELHQLFTEVDTIQSAGNIATPIVITPRKGIAEIPLEPYVQGNSFISANGSEQTKFSVEVYATTDLVTPIHTQELSISNQLYKIPASVLSTATEYACRIRYSDSAGDSAWSSLSVFTTINTEPQVSTPANLSPINAATDILERPELKASEFSGTGEEEQVAAQWQLSLSESNFTSTEFDSFVVWNSKNTIVLPRGCMNVSTTYYWRVRYKGKITGWSLWSTPTAFTTAAELYDHPFLITCPKTLLTDTSEYIRITAIEDDNYVEDAFGSLGISAAVHDVDILFDNSHIAVATWAANGTRVYKRTGTNLTSLSFATNNTARAPSAVKFSPDGKFLAVALYYDGVVELHKRDGDTYTYVGDILADQGISSASYPKIAWSPDSTYLAIADVAFYSLKLFKIVDGDPVVITDLSANITTSVPATTRILNSRIGQCLFWSPDGNTLCILYNSTVVGYKVVLYTRIDDTLVQSTEIDPFPALVAYCGTFIKNGNYLLIGLTNKDIAFRIYELIDHHWVLLPTSDNQRIVSSYPFAPGAASCPADYVSCTCGSTDSKYLFLNFLGKNVGVNESGLYVWDDVLEIYKLVDSSDHQGIGYMYNAYFSH